MNLCGTTHNNSLWSVLCLLNKYPFKNISVFQRILFYYFYLLNYCCTLWHLPKLSQYVIVEFIPLYRSPLSPFPHFWNSFNRFHFFIFVQEYIVFLPYSSFYNLSLHLLPSHWCQPPGRNYFTFQDPFLKTKHFCLYKIARQGVFIVTFLCLYILYLELIHPLCFSPFNLSHLLMVILTSLKILCSFLYRKYINHIHLFNFFLLPSLSPSDLPLLWPVFHNIACICIESIFHIWEKTCSLWLSEPG
jgi:hypothetical protein